MNGSATMASGIWGLILEPGKRYSKSVDVPFHITAAVLDTGTGNDEDEIVSVMLEVDGMEIIICLLSLRRGILQCPLNLKFEEGSRVAFYTNAMGTSVHLSGNTIGNGTIERNFKQKRRKGVNEGTPNAKKMKTESRLNSNSEDKETDDDEDDDNDESEIDASDDDDDEEEDLSDEEDEEEEIEENNKSSKNNLEAAKVKVAAQTPANSKKVVKQGGVLCEDLVVGTGTEAKIGKNVFVYYEGRLASNNKMFDKCQSGRPFKFRLGSKEVIQGWNVGILGMKVGGKRKLLLPPHMAYGKRGAPPDIPPQAKLLFTVELKSVG